MASGWNGLKNKPAERTQRGGAGNRRGGSKGLLVKDVGFTHFESEPLENF